mgnify:CR=1 FL=1
MCLFNAESGFRYPPPPRASYYQPAIPSWAGYMDTYSRVSPLLHSGVFWKREIVYYIRNIGKYIGIPSTNYHAKGEGGIISFYSLLRNPLFFCMLLSFLVFSNTFPSSIFIYLFRIKNATLSGIELASSGTETIYCTAGLIGEVRRAFSFLFLIIISESQCYNVFNVLLHQNFRIVYSLKLKLSSQNWWL